MCVCVCVCVIGYCVYHYCRALYKSCHLDVGFYVGFYVEDKAIVIGDPFGFLWCKFAIYLSFAYRVIHFAHAYLCFYCMFVYSACLCTVLVCVQCLFVYSACLRTVLVCIQCLFEYSACLCVMYRRSWTMVP